MRYLGLVVLGWVLLLSLSHTTLADSVAYKCRIDGIITYQNKPCKKLVNLKQETHDFKTIRLDNNRNVIQAYGSRPAAPAPSSRSASPAYSSHSQPAYRYEQQETERGPTIVGSGIENRTKKARLERERAAADNQRLYDDKPEEKKKFQGRELKFRELKFKEVKFRKRDPRKLQFKDIQFRNIQPKQRESRGVQFRNTKNRSISFKNTENRKIVPILDGNKDLGGN